MKAKKLQKEEERSYEILSNNLILLRHLTEIASSKRVPDDMKPKEKKNLYEQILLFRRSQLRNMIDEENEALEEKEDQLRFFVNSEEREFAKKKEKQSKMKLQVVCRIAEAQGSRWALEPSWEFTTYRKLEKLRSTALHVEVSLSVNMG